MSEPNTLDILVLINGEPWGDVHTPWMAQS